MSRFVRLTLRSVPIFAALFLVLGTIGYLQGDLKPSSINWPSLTLTLMLTVVAVSAVSAGQRLFGEWREKRRGIGGSASVRDSGTAK